MRMSFSQSAISNVEHYVEEITRDGIDNLSFVDLNKYEPDNIY